MNRGRMWVLLLGPVPIVAASVAASRLLRDEPQAAAAVNEVAFADVPSAAQATSGSRAKDLAEPCRTMAAAWRKRLGEDCQVIAREPFVIAGDLSRDELSDWHRRTIEPAAQAIAQRYCKVAPDRPISVLLFSGEASYNDYARRLFGDEGISVYGYFKPREQTLVMNISTGGGTLVHELTHALVAFDFPRIPDWFNEGLASLHEQCQFRSDERGPWIEGLENWRLPALQQAIRRDRLRSLEDLIGADDFRGKREGVNYAQARYFCLYLQREGLLEKFYRRFRDRQRDDPLGVQTAVSLFPDQSWTDVDRQFARWVLSLESPK